jgi:aspartate-semialdehyde dehydrogenase
MKFSTTAALLLGVSTASTAFGFSPSPSTSFVKSTHNIATATKQSPFISSRRTARTMSKRNSSTLSMKAVSIGVVGATGAVGKEIVDCLNKSSLDVSKLRIFGSSRSAGTTRDAGKFGDVPVELFDVAAARECDVVFLAVSGEFALEHAKAISEGEDGAVVIDNSSAFRYDKDIPLVVPEINGECTKGAKLIANPNCTTAIGLMALWPLHKLFKLKKVMMSVSFL